ncbi:hypothetical protein M1534_02120 [Patescibacteria group bacterium]|nr:hypothetical protein [Patescibacteria group bacterium]
MSQELLDYIERELAAGRRRDHITRILEEAGWHRRDIDAAFSHLHGSSELPAPQYRNAHRRKPSAAAHHLPDEARSGERDRVFIGPSFLLRQMFAVYVRRWKTLADLSSILVVGFFVSALIAGSLSSFLSGSSASVSGIRSVIGTLFFLALLGWVLPAMLYAIRDNVGTSEALRLGWRKLIVFWLFIILLTIIVTAGLSLFIIPGIILSIWFSVALFVLVYEDRGILHALAMSKEYVRGHWWDVFWVRSFFGFLVGALAFIAGLGVVVNAIIANSAQIFSLLPHISNALSTASWVFDLVAVFFIMPLSLIYYFLVYDYLRQRRPDVMAERRSQRQLTTLLIILIVLGVLAGWGLSQGVAAIGRNLAANVGRLATPASLNPLGLPYGNPAAPITTPSSSAVDDMSRLINLSTFSKAMDLYYAAHNAYPATSLTCGTINAQTLSSALAQGGYLSQASVSSFAHSPDYFAASSTKGFVIGTLLQNGPENSSSLSSAPNAGQVAALMHQGTGETFSCHTSPNTCDNPYNGGGTNTPNAYCITQ